MLAISEYGMLGITFSGFVECREERLRWGQRWLVQRALDSSLSKVNFIWQIIPTMKSSWPWIWHDWSWATESTGTLRSKEKKDLAWGNQLWGFYHLIIRQVVAKGLEERHSQERAPGLRNWSEEGRWDSSTAYPCLCYESKSSLTHKTFLIPHRATIWLAIQVNGAPLSWTEHRMCNICETFLQHCHLHPQWWAQQFPQLACVQPLPQASASSGYLWNWNTKERESAGDSRARK